MEFRKIDTNNGGYVLFDEFTDYCIRKSLDIQNPNLSNKTSKKGFSDDKSYKPKPVMNKLPRQNPNKKRTTMTLEQLQRQTEELMVQY